MQADQVSGQHHRSKDTGEQDSSSHAEEEPAWRRRISGISAQISNSLYSAAPSLQRQQVRTALNGGSLDITLSMHPRALVGPSMGPAAQRAQSLGPCDREQQFHSFPGTASAGKVAAMISHPRLDYDCVWRAFTSPAGWLTTCRLARGCHVCLMIAGWSSGPILQHGTALCHCPAMLQRQPAACG